MPPRTMHEAWRDAMADAQACACWLNCYLREFAGPAGEVDPRYAGFDRPGAGQGEPAWLRIGLPGGARLCIRLAHRDALGRCRFASAPYLKRGGEAWHRLDANALALCLLTALGGAHGPDPRLLAQSRNSVAVTAALLERAGHARRHGDVLLDAEQSMLWGHPLHPTPKSREGVPMAALLDCAPEARGAFRLFWFRIEPSLLRVSGTGPGDTLARLSGRDDAYPCHPWEAARLLAMPSLRQPIAQGHIAPLGALGEKVFPTSSVRTLYHPALDYFLKCSVHVRLTNCVRKNAWYELESAIALDRLLEGEWRALAAAVPGFEVLREPAATTLDFSTAGVDAPQARALLESFGILYRRNLPPEIRAAWRPQVAGALFTLDHEGRSVAAALLRPLARRHGRARATLRWFEAYAGLLLEGTWSALFEHGIVLEPHLQNTLLGLRDGWPARMWVRDMEGIKLTPSHWPDQRLGELPAQVRQSLRYTATQGWNRVAYCTLVNNLGEAVFHLAAGDRALEARLWRCVGAIARDWQRRHGTQPLLQALLAGAPLPAKNNLTLRLHGQADRHAGYTLLPSPLAAAP